MTSKSRLILVLALVVPPPFRVCGLAAAVSWQMVRRCAEPGLAVRALGAQ